MEAINKFTLNGDCLCLESTKPSSVDVLSNSGFSHLVAVLLMLQEITGLSDTSGPVHILIVLLLLLQKFVICNDVLFCCLVM